MSVSERAAEGRIRHWVRKAWKAVTGMPSECEPRGSAWKVRVYVKSRDLRYKLGVIDNNQDGANTRWAELEKELDCIDSLIDGPRPWRFIKVVRDWWTGRRIEQAWQLIHMVERCRLQTMPGQSLVIHRDDFITQASKHLSVDHASIRKVQKWKFDDFGDKGDAYNVLRDHLLDLMEHVHRASDKLFESVRSLRNRLLGISIAAITAEAIGVLIQKHYRDMTIILAPDSVKCSRTPSWTFLFFVMLAGGLGGFITALRPMITSKSGDLAYSLPFQQAFLKLAIAPLIAVAGIMLFYGGFTGHTADSAAEVFGAALLFGSGQQLVTRFADQRAGDLAKEPSSTTE